jgi:7-carboxy-7-deazaguanine synthase
MRIVEIFYSLQGEGVLAGVPSVFIRTAGCNLACRWCDTRYARDPAAGTELAPGAVMERLAQWPQARHCVVTGGEPTLAPELPELTGRLRAAGLHITIETNATAWPEPFDYDLASLSPKLRHAGPGTPPIDPARLRAWIRKGREAQLKLACSGTEDLPEILALQSALADCLPPDRILLMPLTDAGARTNRARCEAVAEMCLAHGYRYAGRLHVELFGGRRGR